MASTGHNLTTVLRLIWLFVCLRQCGSSYWRVPASKNGAKVKCTPDYIQLEIDRGRYHYLDPESYRVNNTWSCKSYFYNETRVIMRIPLFGRCGATVSEYADMLMFDNIVQAEVFWSPSGITRYPDHVFIFKCLYFRTAKLSLTSFTPDGKIIKRPPKGKTGKFSFKMEMFHTEKYVKPYTSYPVRVNLAERIYLQVKTVKKYNNLILFLENCRATLSSDPYDRRNHTLIGEGCPVDETVNLKQGISTFQRFSLEAFRFLPQKKSQNVYVHCEVLMCFKENKNSRCIRDCRKKRSPASRNTKLGNRKYMASLGPLRDPSDDKPSGSSAVSGSDIGARVFCDGDYMRLVLDRAKYPYIDPESFALNATGQGCNVYTLNKTHVTSRIPLDGCGTTVSEYADLLTFYNSLNTEVKKTKSGITRHHAIEFRLECSYFRTSALSLMAFNPIGKIVTKPTTETGNFTFKMNMFQTDKFLSPYTHFPVKVHLNERIFLQVKMKENASDLVLHLENCRATPSNNGSDDTGYEFIKDGCPVDETLNLKQGTEPRQRFSLKAFRFIPGAMDVYLHCQVLVCHKKNPLARCNKDCTKTQPSPKPQSQILRHRRDLAAQKNDTNATVVGNKQYMASVGPVRILLEEVLVPVLRGVRNKGSVNSSELTAFSLLITTALTMTLQWSS